MGICARVCVDTHGFGGYCLPSQLSSPPASIHSCGGDTDTGRSQHISSHNDSQPACFKGDKGPKTHSVWKNWHYLSLAETITGPMQNKPNAFLMSYRLQSHKRFLSFFLFFFIFGRPGRRCLTADEPNLQSNIILHPETVMRPDCVAKSPQGCHNSSQTLCEKHTVIKANAVMSHSDYFFFWWNNVSSSLKKLRPGI